MGICGLFVAKSHMKLIIINSDYSVLLCVWQTWNDSTNIKVTCQEQKVKGKDSLDGVI